jgi:hypothetical protein
VIELRAKAKKHFRRWRSGRAAARLSGYRRTNCAASW